MKRAGWPADYSSFQAYETSTWVPMGVPLASTPGENGQVPSAALAALSSKRCSRVGPAEPTTSELVTLPWASTVKRMRDTPETWARSAARIDANDPACKPEFPPAALRAQVSGVSRIRFTVDANGKVTAADVVGSSGPTREHRLLDNAAKSALATCPFTAGVDANGTPIGTQVEVSYAWKLE